MLGTEMSDEYEKETALYEAERNRAWHSWFANRGHIPPTDEHTLIFDGGFRMAWEFCRAQPSAEPVAWAQSEHSYDPERHGMQRRLSWKKLESDDAPLYAHPPTDSAALRDAGVSEQDLMALLPGPYYMDTPDGGSVTVLEQLQRMARDAARWRAACAMKDFPQYMGVFGWQMAEIAEMFDTPDQAIDAAIAQQEAGHDPAL